MDKLEFEELGPKGKIIFMNQELSNGSTLTSISEEISISRKTIAKKLKVLGYKYNKQQKQFIKDSEYKYNTDILEVAATSTAPEAVKNEYKHNTNIFNTKEAKNKMLDLLEKHNDIEEMLKWYHNQRNVIEVDLNELKIDSDKLVGAIKITTVRLYSEVWESFREFMEDNKQFKSMDLISMAMVEYIEKYKK